ncbi:hypothetical protein FJ364_04695, partial [Candidatus Dependentiae bacterium]|nr:hypothetical protein [Candidatus Dependentiae bacterium]
MTFVKNILCASTIRFSLLCAMQQPINALFNQELQEEFTLKLSSYALRQTRTLTSSEGSALSAVL